MLICRHEALQFFKPGSNNISGRLLFMGFRELKRGALEDSHCGESQLTGTNRFSSSNQFNTTMRRGGPGFELEVVP